MAVLPSRKLFGKIHQIILTSPSPPASPIVTRLTPTLLIRRRYPRLHEPRDTRTTPRISRLIAPIFDVNRVLNNNLPPITRPNTAAKALPHPTPHDTRTVGNRI